MADSSVRLEIITDIVPVMDRLLAAHGKVQRLSNIGPPRYVAMSSDLTDLERLLVIDAYDRGTRPGLDGWTITEFNEVRVANGKDPLPELPEDRNERIAFFVEQLGFDR